MTTSHTPHIALSSVATRLLKKMAGGNPLRQQSGVYHLGPKAVDRATLDELERADLIVATRSGPVISVPGRRYIERLMAVDDGFAGQNRLLTKTVRKIDETPQKVTVNLADNPLAWLARRKLVTPAQLHASDRLQADYYLSQQAPRVTMNWGAPPLGHMRRGAPEGIDPTSAQIAAKRRFDTALAVVGDDLSPVLVRVVCAGEGLESAEKALAWPARAAKLVLGFALDRLVAHYGIRA
jgi:hypothetical protein